VTVTAPRGGAPAGPLRGARLPPTAVATLCALVLAVLVEAAPVVGGDLTAQEWWASWATSNGSPVDLGWYGGVPVASYSLLSPWVGALLGLPVAGILGTVLGAVCTTALLGRLRPVPTRWTLAGVAAAATWAADQWSGRTTFGLGAALATLALVVAGGPRRRVAGPAGAVVAVLAGATSPLASVFLLVAAGAWWWGARPSGRLRPGPAGPWWIALGAVLPVGAARLLGAVSGPQPSSAHQMLGALAATGLTWALVPPVHRILRAGVALTAALILLTWVLSDPVGSNSVRLVLLFAVPVLVAVARTEPSATLLAALAVAWLLPPLVAADLVPRDARPVSERAQSLLHELGGLGPVGRIEVVPMHGHEESTEVAGTVPLARGWLRQLDTARDPLFYDGSLDAPRYLRWLRDNGVSYVVLPSGPLDWPSGPEARLLRHGVPGLSPVWGDRWWRLFEVRGGGVVAGSGTLVSSDRSRMVVDVTSPGRTELAVWWSRWSSLSGPSGCVQRGPRDGWTTLVADRPGRYVLTSSWRPQGRCGRPAE
jgi:hypothetical protein